MVKRFLGSILLFICGTFQAFALPSEIITLDKNAVVKPEINTQDRAEVIKGTLLINDSEELAKIIDE